MRIVATADLHGNLPEIPDCDLLLIAGDICPYWDHGEEFQRNWLLGEFSAWLEDWVPARKVVLTWGNHDLYPERNSPVWEKPPPILSVLVDELLEWEGVRIYGMPWSKDFFPEHWAFNLSEDEMVAKVDAIPPCDILITHGPPYGYGDKTVSGENAGFKCLKRRLADLQPALTFFGHIHECGGQWFQRDDRDVGEPPLAMNVSYLDEKYKPRRGALQVIEWEK